MIQRIYSLSKNDLKLLDPATSYTVQYHRLLTPTDDYCSLQYQIINWGKRSRSMDDTTDFVPVVTDAPSEAKQIRAVASRSPTNPYLWRQASNVSNIQVQKKNVTGSMVHLKFRITDSFSQMNGQHRKPTHSHRFINDSVLWCLHTVVVSFLPLCSVTAVQETCLKHAPHFYSIQHLQVNDLRHIRQELKQRHLCKIPLHAVWRE